MCSWGISTLLWPSRSGTFSRDYVSYGVRTSSSNRRQSYSRPAPLSYSVGVNSGSSAYYGSRYHPSSSSRTVSGDPWTPPPRVASFVPSQGQSQSQSCRSSRSHQGYTSSYRTAADAFRHSSCDPVPSAEPSRRHSGQKHVRFANNVEGSYLSGSHRSKKEDQDRSRHHRRRGEDEDYYGRSSSGREHRGHSRHEQTGHDNTYYDAYERSPRAAIQRRNSARIEDASLEDTQRRASKHSRAGGSRRVEVEVRYS
ncbi:hypothetical protein CMQ_6550 [Grosmannia clavigera kw1407]|uniref:Uncharacterized protein n=1 Tax=Grosmannia clavigera (strain kw1407 / UAMH 11150) TaxID=655863 RepID=F0X6T2_GROCL|nr:uncharacterized protein CMQ_6550 [Grosmannia clavigera kw1407]EFX06229.1 hypothetical protein CMQ_6550 [Grosmannia clavigera kw1407]